METMVWPGEPEWKKLLQFTLELRIKSTHNDPGLFPENWEEISPGSEFAPAFGHWNVVHQILDALYYDPVHAKNQILNLLHYQQDDGFLPGLIRVEGKEPGKEPGKQPVFQKDLSCPPLWPLAVEAYLLHTADEEILQFCYQSLLKQIDWFEKNRKAEDGGFFYSGIESEYSESGMEGSIRFKNQPPSSRSCIDATSHLWQMYTSAHQWGLRLGFELKAEIFRGKAERLGEFIRNNLFDSQTGWFFDSWEVNNTANTRPGLEGVWPLVLGIADQKQGEKMIDEWIVNPLKTWQEPIRNSMNWWAALGMVRYERQAEARELLNKSLSQSAEIFAETGTIWEFYPPEGNSSKPSRDYLGHNPFFAMARLYDSL